MATATKPRKNYDESSISVLEGLEPVRVRPAMYIGATDKKGLHHLVWEIVDNSVDEYLNGHADSIHVILHKSGDAVTVTDNGRGIPVGMHPKHRKPTLELILTTLHSGAKFGDGQDYIHSGGLHGVGSSVVNALSRKLVATVHRDGFEYRQTFKRGKTATELEKVGPFRGHGTSIYFEPDPDIFKVTHFDSEWIKAHLEDMSYIHSGLKIHFKNDATGENLDLTHPGGIPDFLTRLVEEQQKPPINPTPFHSVKEGADKMELALQWTESTDETFRSYVNGIRTTDGGTHEAGFKSGIVKAVRNFIETHDIKLKGVSINAEDIREGVVGILSVFLRNPAFQGQTKEKLNNPEMNAVVEGFVRPALESWLNSNKSVADQIVGRIVLAARARLASREAAQEVKRKSPTQRRLNLPGKLADCKSTDLDETELFIVEGDSAGGCFSGDTQVALADGRTLNFMELAAEQAEGKGHFCYTIRPDGQVGLERIINVRRTKTNAGVIRVTLDNGERIVCTPDHRFMLRDGGYKPAAKLRPGDSLMPLYRKLSDVKEPGITIDGYEMTWDPRSECWLFTHLLADWYNRWRSVYQERDGDHCHHVDFDKRNNNPTNIRRLPRAMHLALHRDHVAQTLHRPEIIAKCRQIRESAEFREMMSQRMKQPQTRHILSEQAKAQWEDDAYKAYMGEKWREFYEANVAYRQQNAEQLFEAQRRYWQQPEHRQAQAERVRAYFAEHAEAREALAAQATEQWQDDKLRAWRRAETARQWTPEFRTKRRAALRETFYGKTIAALKRFATASGKVDLAAYDAHRRGTRDKSLLRFDTFCARYFEGDEGRAWDAVTKHNHRVVTVESLPDRIDVFDLEVPGTHNFALAAGVFVHNSAKQGRNSVVQAVLPLRGKVLNSEGLTVSKVLSNQELADLVTAIGTGAGENFNLAGLRYGKIILLMDADADGHHITTLLLTFFFRHMTELIKKGHLYVAQPPLYRIDVGKETHWARDDVHKEQILAGLRANAKPEITRFKGLGEMMPKVLAETTLDPRKRTLLRVSIDSLIEADKTFVELLGKDPASRYRFITESANQVVTEDLDI